MSLGAVSLFHLIAGISIWSRISVEAFSRGPPAAACRTLSPNPFSHGATPLETPLPSQVLDLTQLDINVNGDYFYTPGETYQSMYVAMFIIMYI